MTAYKEIAYLESTGTQYIDPGINADSNLGIEYTYLTPTLTNEALRFGAIWTDGTKVIRHHTSYVNSFYANGYYVGKSNYIAVCNTDTTTIHTYKLDATTQKSYIDGVECTMHSQTTYEPFDCQMNYWLFGRNCNDTSLISYASLRIYKFKMYNGSTLVRDFIPVLDFNNTPAMYDKENNVLYYNQGTGQFKYAIKPYKCEVEYLESTGTGTYTSGQYIDTGLDYFADFEITAKQRESAGMKALGTLTTYCVERENATTNSWRFRNGESTFFTTSLLVTDLHTLKWKNGKVYGDSVELGSFAKTSNTGRMYLFGAATPTDATRINRYPLQIYSCKLWNPTTGELVRDYIPVIDNDDVPCMYDKVSKQCFYNQGTGSFLYGRQIKEVEYIESTGTQYIDTGYIPTNNTSFDLFGINMDYTANTTRFGSRVGVANENYCFTSIASNDFRFTYGSGPSTTSIQYIYSTRKLAKKVSYDAITKICTITFNDDTTESSSAFTTTPLTSSAKSIYLFAFNNNDSPVFGISKQSGLKIYEGTELVRDYIPAIDENGIAFMFDRISHVIYDNAGAGEFLYGPQVVERGNPSLSLRRKLMMLLARGKKKYTPVKYIQSSGTQYIVSPVQFYGDNYKIECKFDNSDTPRDTTPFGYQNTGSGVQIMVVGFNNANSTGTIFWNGTSTAHANRAKLNVMTKGLNELVIEANNGTLTYTLNGASPVSYETSTSFEPQTENMWIFGNNRQSMGGSHQLATMKFYYLRIYQNNEIKYNFISVLDSKGVPCILETVSGVYYYNQGTGDFTYEEWDYTPCDYVYADGSAYANTLWYGDSNTKMEMVFDIAEQAAGNTGSMGSRISANSQLLAIGYGASALAADFNNSSYSPYRAAIVYELNKKYTAYTSKEKRSIVDADTGTILDENNTLCTDTMSTGVLLLGAETGITARHVGNIYSGKIWEGDTLVRDYIPVVDGDNKGCFYDKTLNALFYSAGSSDFVGHFVENGVDYKVVKNIIAEQVETSTNTRDCPFIKTGYIPGYSKKTRMIAKFAFAHTDTNYEYFCGMNYGGRFVFGHASTNNRVYFGLGAQNYTTNYVMDTDVHLYKLDWATAKAGIDDNEYSLTSAGQYDQTSDFWINGRHAANYTNVNRPMGGTSYWWKFWEGKKLVYNGIPAVRLSDNKVGLFETINREFQTTAGTVEYTYTE